MEAKVVVFAPQFVGYAFRDERGLWGLGLVGIYD